MVKLRLVVCLELILQLLHNFVRVFVIFVCHDQFELLFKHLLVQLSDLCSGLLVIAATQERVQSFQVFFPLLQRVGAQEAHVVVCELKEHLHVVILALLNRDAKFLKPDEEGHQSHLGLKCLLRVILCQFYG